jgi:hypothetical protein
MTNLDEKHHGKKLIADLSVGGRILELCNEFAE